MTPASPARPHLAAALDLWIRALQMALLLALLLALILWPQPAWGQDETATLAPSVPADPDGSRLFELHCAGCHPNGGNVIRRGRTLRLADLRRQGLEGEAAIATVAAEGIGRMDGYAAALGDGGSEAVAAWVWQQAQADWSRQP